MSILEDHEVVTLLQNGKPLLYAEIPMNLLGPDTHVLLEKYSFLTLYTLYSAMAECYFSYGYNRPGAWWWEFLWDHFYRAYEGALDDSDEYDVMIHEIATCCLPTCPSLGVEFEMYIRQLGMGTDGLYICINDTSFEGTQVVWFYED